MPKLIQLLLLHTGQIRWQIKANRIQQRKRIGKHAGMERKE